MWDDVVPGPWAGARGAGGLKTPKTPTSGLLEAWPLQGPSLESQTEYCALIMTKRPAVAQSAQTTHLDVISTIWRRSRPQIR
jgi:hypothetical protein